MNYFAMADDQNGKLLFHDFCKGRKITRVKFSGSNVLKVYLEGKRHNRLLIEDESL